MENAADLQRLQVAQDPSVPCLDRTEADAALDLVQAAPIAIEKRDAQAIEARADG